MQAEDLNSSAAQQLANLCSSWKSSTWEELDWNRAKLLSIRDLLEARQRDFEQVRSVHCLRCPNIVKHVSIGPVD